MGWSLSPNLPARDPEAVDAALMAAGRALYLANGFEMKCRFVLRTANLATYVESHPEATFADALATLARQKCLGPTIAELKPLPGVEPDEFPLLDKACEARNFIAHEGAAFGYVFSVSAARIGEHLEKLRSAVVNLARGDSLVSRWVYEIEEKEPAPLDVELDYPVVAEAWVFGGPQCP